MIDQIERLTGREINYVLDEKRVADQLVYVTDFGKLHRHTGWQPEVRPAEALKRMYRWWKNNRELFPAKASEPAIAAVLQEFPRTA